MSPKSLSRLLLVKERLRQWKRAELAAANATVEQAQARFVVRDELRLRAEHAVIDAGELTGDELAMRADVMKRAHFDLKQAHSTLLDSHRERDVQSDEVASANRDVRVLETLRERMVSELNRAQNIREQGELDDISGHARRKL